MTKKLLLTAMLATFLFVGVAQAQTEELPDPGILPGNPFYFLKSATEGIGTFFTFGDVAKADRFIYLAEKRLSEAQALTDAGELERAQRATEKYEKRLAKSLEKAEEAKTKGKNVDEILARFAEATIRHQEVLARVYEKVPEQAKAAIERVMQKGAEKYDRAINAVSSEKKVEIKARIEKKNEEVRARLETLRGRGVPIPKINFNRGDSDDE